MGKKFGNLTHVTSQVWFTISPFEQRAFAKFFKSGVPNTIRRIAEEAPYVIPPLLAAYALYSWTNSQSERMHRKAYIAEHGH